MSNPIDRSSEAEAREQLRQSRLHDLRVLDTGTEPLFDALTQAAALVTGAPIALVSLIDDDRQWFKSNVGLDGVDQTPRDIAFCAHTIRGDELLEIPDATRDARFADNPLVRGAPDIRFYAGAPIVMSDGLRMGSLCVIDRVPRTLTPLQGAVLKHLAAAAAEALEQRRLVLEHTASAQRQLESERLRAADQARLENIIGAIRAATWEWDVQSGAMVCNERWATTVGYSLDDLAPMTIVRWQHLVHPVDWPRSMELIEQHLAGATPFVDTHMRMRHRNGSWIWVACRGSIVSREEDGSPKTVYGTYVDITSRKEVERRLQASEAALERTGRLASVGGWEFDLANGEIHWSDETCRIHEVPIGYRPTLDEGIDFYPPDVREPLRAVVEKAVSDGSGWDLELPFETAKGRALWVRTFGTVEFDEGKPRWLIGALQDVTMRRRAVEALEKSERRFRKLFEGSLGLICMHDMKGMLLAVNPAAAASLGYAVQDMMGQSLADFMRVTDVWIMDAYLERIAANGVDSGILRLLTRDGELRIWEYRNVVDDEDAPPHVLGYAQDVTDRERTQRELHERSVRDPLTGCRNRAYLADLADRWKPDDAFACIAVDLDRFKQVNDTFGHHRGDEVLVQMGHFLGRFLRPEDVVVRVGGDEFLAVLMGADEAVTRNVSRRLLENKDAAPIGFTLGSAVRRPKQTLDQVWAEADRKLYESRGRRM